MTKALSMRREHLHHNQNHSNDQSRIRKLSQDLRHPAREIMLQCFSNDFEHPIFATGEKKKEISLFKTYGNHGYRKKEEN